MNDFRGIVMGSRYILSLLIILSGKVSALQAPEISPGSGPVIAPTLLSINNPNPSGAIFYTIDGTDPRTLRGSVRSSARIHPIPLEGGWFGGPASVNRSMVVHARVKSGDEWSSLTSATFESDQDFSKLLITEVMFHPTDSGPELEEFIEFKNIGDIPLNISGLRILDLAPGGDRPHSDIFPEDTLVHPGGFFLMVASTEKFQSLYPDVPFHGTLTGKLSNSLARIALTSSDGSIATQMRFDTHYPWAVVPDNHGYYEDLPQKVGFSLTRTNLDPKADPNHFSTWRASAQRLGSPGADDPEANVPPLLINELRTRSAGELRDSVEIFNPTPDDVNMGGWWLSEHRNQPYRYRFAADMIIPGGGYLVVDELDFAAGGSDLSFSSIWDRCYLFSGDPEGELTGYAHGVRFSGSAQNASFGRHQTSEGIDYFLAESIPSFGLENFGPNPPSLRVSEIMYHPDVGGFPYIELHNPTQETLSLWEFEKPTRTWGISSYPYVGVPQYYFPENTTVPPGGRILCVPESSNPVNIPDDVQIFKIPNYIFANTRGRIRLLCPSGRKGGETRYITIDEAIFQYHHPWDIGAAGGGQGLERVGDTSRGEDPNSWCAGPPGGSPGVAWEGACLIDPIPDIAILITGDEFKLTFTTVADYYYSLEESSDLAIWRPLPDAHLVGDGLEAIFTRSLDDTNGSPYLVPGRKEGILNFQREIFCPGA
jgi:hypothetical protein